MWGAVVGCSSVRGSKSPAGRGRTARRKMLPLSGVARLARYPSSRHDCTSAGATCAAASSRTRRPHSALSARAARRMSPQIWNSWVSRSSPMAGRPAHLRNTILARAADVRHGTTSRFAEARLPVIVISRWRTTTRPRSPLSPTLGRFNASRSGELSSEDQLTVIAVILPKRVRKASTNSGSSRAIEAVCGHHAPSSGAPSSIAKATRTGLARRRAPTAPFMALTLSRREPPASCGRTPATSSPPPVGLRATRGDPSTTPSLRPDPAHTCGDRQTKPVTDRWLRCGREPEIRAGYERKPHYGHYTHGAGNRTGLSDQATTRSLWLSGPRRRSQCTISTAAHRTCAPGS